MAINKIPVKAFTSGDLATDVFTATAGQTAFTLSLSATDNSVIVYVNDVVQAPTTDYTVNGTTLTFASGLTVGDEVIVRTIARPSALNTVEDGAISSAKLATGAIESKLGYTPVSPTLLTSSVNTAVSNLVNAAPTTLDTLNELATALGNDANFSTTITTALATKANQSTTYTKTETDALITPTNVSDKTNTSTGYFSMPKGTTAQRPISVDAGDTRFNTTANAMEVYTGSAWSLIGAKDGSSYAAAATSATAIWDLGLRGKGLFWIQKADGTPIQVYCDLDTLGQDGKGGWMLVGSWATASEWTKDSTSSSATFGSTALNCFSSNFGNTNMQHMRVKVATSIDLASASSEADWYYYWNSPIQWKTVWAAGAGTNNHWNSATGVNNGASTPRNSLRQFSFAYNLKFSYTANYQTWANLSDSGTSGSTGTEAWYDWYSGLTTPGYTLGVYNAGGAGRGDGSLAITFGGDTSTTAGHDCNFNNCKYGWDDTALVAVGGTSGSYNLNGQSGTLGANTNLWMWIK